MKKGFKLFACLSAMLLMAISASAAQVELYALDGRTLMVEESQVELYTAEGMGWFAEKPVTLYALDGRTLVVPADKVEAHRKVGWYLESEINNTGNESETPETDGEAVTDTPETEVVVDNKVAVKYTDGTIVRVPKEHLNMYIALGWAEVDSDAPASENVTVYDVNGNTKEVYADEAEKLESEGWYSSYGEAVYKYAVEGTSTEDGSEKLLKDKKYEMAYTRVQEAIDKLAGTETEYSEELYDVRSDIMDTWNAAAKSPLGFINYWFNEKDGKKIVVFEYRNVGDSRITSFKINFDVCNAAGEVIETNSGSYYVEKLQMDPCDKKRVAWAIERGDDAKSIKNLKVKEVVFSDGTKWSAEN